MTTVCLTFDFDALSLWITTMKQVSATPLSRGEYGARVGLPRILDLLARKSVPATFFVPAHTARAFPDSVRLIHDQGHEVALHGYCHETPVGLPADEEERLLDRSIEGLRSVLGEGYTPKGYRSPAWDLSEHSIAALQARGLLYDSSMMADDFRPYLARIGDEVTPDAFRPGRPSDVVELPVAWELDDFPHFVFLNRPLYLGLRTPAEVLALWTEEFDTCDESAGTFTLTMHPQIIGRGPRVRMLEALIGHMQGRPGVAFRTCAEEAMRQRALLARPL